MTPTEIYRILGTDVVGQEDALRDMSVAIYKHLIEHAVGNVMMIGNSGTGKTTIMKATERFFAQARGYEKYATIIRINANLVADLASRGAQTNVVMDRLAQQAARLLGERADLETMRDYVAHGIVCIDEVDKIRATVGGEPNVKGIVAQDSLLTLMENEHVQVELPCFEKGKWQTRTTPINTEHVLFVAGGAFEELYDQVYHRVTGKAGADKFWKLVPRSDGSMERRFVFNLRSFLTQEDMFRYGMTPQFLSRFDSTIMLRDFSAPDLIRIFRDIPDAIWPVAVDYFRHAGITLTITDEAVLLIADKAVTRNRLGARALREVFSTIMRRLEFDPLSSGLVQDLKGAKVLEITSDMVEAAA